ncbi:3-keto-5-aminohexanoate cleavage protein [Streptomyces erythrochromogenes]|uniref:3-keto-5-aminohexanoate cleavage protein n=1 Tax=Streptomyces erythrochromogenes TaxID=285574 RepID=UPI003866BFF3|nr:3-keto-5-aminohexanoate cleavage protein [Streptomyces erythrochromogenes]
MRAVGGPAVVSVNGSRGAGDGPAVPLSPQDLAESAVRAVAAGAGEVLVHPRTPCGRESLSPRVVGPVLEVLRDAGVGVPLTVPASIAAEPDPAERPARVRAWTVLPDRAVVHFAEPGAAVLAEVLLERGVLVDAVAPLGGAAGPEPLERLRAWLVRSPGGDRGGVRVVAEIVAGKTGKAGPADERATGPACLPTGLHGLAPQAVLLFGRDGASWPVLRLAARCGTAARTGVGDVLHLPDGRPARSNAELVAAARELMLLEGSVRAASR